MKKQISICIGLIMMFVISSVNAIYAQSETTAKVHISFDFSVRDKIFPAGDYVLNREDNSGKLWLLYGKNNRESVVLLSMEIALKETLGNGKLTFRRYGDNYFLAAFETSAYKIGLHKSREEKNLVRELKNISRTKNSKINVKPEIVAINMDR